MKETIRELFLTDWVHNATTEEIVEKLIQNDERHKEIDRLNNIINELEKWLEEEKDIQGTTIENKIYYEILDKLKKLKEGK